jgi:hypothetical protein
LWLVPPNPHYLLHHQNGHHHGLHIPHPHLHHRHNETHEALIPKKAHSRQSSKDLSHTSHHPKIHGTLTELITKTVPSTFPDALHPPEFVPHLTITSEINLSALKPDPSAWLERLAVPQIEDVLVRFTSVGIGNSFTKKLFLRADKTGLEGLGELIRWQAVESPNGIGGEEERKRAENWAEQIWEPHVSLL